MKGSDASAAFLLMWLPFIAKQTVDCTFLVGIGSGLGTWIISWGALEHWLHRSDHHKANSRHMQHHKCPGDPTLRDVDIPAVLPKFAAYLVCLWIYAGVWACLGQGISIVLMYANYESVHMLSHLTDATLEAKFAKNSEIHTIPVLTMVKWHQKHHDAWGVNYGVTTPFWDIVSGTASKKTREWFTSSPAFIVTILPVTPLWCYLEKRGIDWKNKFRPTPV